MADKITNPAGRGRAATAPSPIKPTNRGTAMRPTTTTPSGTFDPKSLTLSNRQIEQLIRQRSATTTTPTSTSTGAGTTGRGGGRGTTQETVPTPNQFDLNNNGINDALEGGQPTGGGIDPALQYQMDVDAANRKSAFQLLQDEFKQYGLDTLAAEVQNFMQEGLGAAEARIAIRNTQAYKERFKGNEGRLKKGLAVYQPNEYLAAEETYRNLLLANNLQDLVNRNTTDAFIAGAVSAQEVQDRIQNVFNRIDNADPALKSQLGQYFNNFGIADPNLQRTQLASALLTGETSSMALERQLKKAQLRAGAQMAGVTIAEPGVESLQKQLEAQNVSDVYGVAKTGFKTLAETQAEAQRLAGIYGGEQPPLAEELQQEAFFGLESQRRKKLQEREKATFGGQAGVSTAALSKGIAGSI